MAPQLPVLVDIDGRPVLLVGGGRVAGRRAERLLALGARLTVVAPSLGDVLADLTGRGVVRWINRAYRPADVADRAALRWALVIAATDDAETNRQVVADGREAGAWVNDASSPDGADVSFPAVHRRGPVTVAVGTSGVHPGAAAWLRDVAAGSLRDEHLVALDLADQVRAASPEGTRPDWRAAVESGMLELIREGRVAEAKERLQACLSSSSD